MTRIPSWLVVIMAVMLAVLGGRADSAQDKYTLKVPDGLAFSEFRGYEDWQTVAVSQPEGVLNAILANPAMISAYRAGVPGNGKPFPDGSKIAKIQWKAKKSAEAPLRRAGAGHHDRRAFDRKGQQEVPGHRWMGIRPVQL